MKQTVTSKYEPKSKNVTWIDMSTGSPILKNFINGMWRPTGGGSGAGSSNPTEADATKVWQVTPVQKGTKTEETVIVPEQTLVNEQELEYNDKFVPGAQCVAVVNGVEYRGEVMTSKKDDYVFEAEFGSFIYYHKFEEFQFYNYTESPKVTAKLSVVGEVPDYDYNWAPGVKIPIPTAEDEGKILVVTKTEGNTSTIAPEQEVPADNQTPLTDVDLTKFVVGNTVKVTVTYEGQEGGGGKREVESANSETFTATRVIKEGKVGAAVIFDIQELHDTFEIAEIENSLLTTAYELGLSDATIKLEYIESNYEYQLQENIGGGNSDVLWPAIYEYNENTMLATFVPEDVKPGTWCMVCGSDNGNRHALPVYISKFDEYNVFNGSALTYFLETVSWSENGKNGALLYLAFLGSNMQQ